MNKGWIIVLLVAFLSYGCKKELGTPRPLDDRFMVEDFEFTYLTSRAKLKYQDGDQKISVTANFRIRKDSIIWVSLSPALGIEAVRILVNAEGVYVMDRINKQYMTYSYARLSQMYGVEVGYSLIEAVLLGNPLFQPVRRKDINPDGRFFGYQRVQEGYGLEHYVGRNSKKLERLHAYQMGSNNSIVVNYGTFEKHGEQKVPLKIRGRVKFDEQGKEDAVIDIEYSKLQPQEDKLAFPFHVSEKYTKK